MKSLSLTFLLWLIFFLPFSGLAQSRDNAAVPKMDPGEQNVTMVPPINDPGPDKEPHKLRSKTEVKLREAKEKLKHFEGDKEDSGSEVAIIKDLIWEQELEMDSIRVAYANKLEASERNQSKTLSALILGFGLICALLVLLFYYKILNKMSDKVLKLVALIIIASLSVFLIVAGFSNEQITPVVGLLGTLTGYVISKSDGTPPATNDAKL